MHSQFPARRNRYAHSRAVLAVALVALIAACSGTADSASQPPGQPQASGMGTSSPDPLSPGTGAPSQTEAPGTPGPTLPRVPPLQAPAYASRVVVDDLGIDLPVVSGDLQPPPNYPFCDVAAYVTRFNQPYEAGVTYISAHAQRGMFAPLLQASERADGAELIGIKVQVFVSDGRQFDYRIDRVVRHAVDYAVVAELPFDEQHLILQTSEGVYGTVEKLQVIAALESQTTIEPDLAAPEPQPRDCRPDELLDPSTT